MVSLFCNYRQYHNNNKNSLWPLVIVVYFTNMIIKREYKIYCKQRKYNLLFVWMSPLSSLRHCFQFLHYCPSEMKSSWFTWLPTSWDLRGFFFPSIPRISNPISRTSWRNFTSFTTQSVHSVPFLALFNHRSKERREHLLGRLHPIS